ncbi:hypothetical protein [Steroidobacter sp.]|uniref:hypothetical protein n=1 Tax=Steroidobacter sp. TaxID=1978227 RepID=UPI0025E723F6|nr:hypothetical protein [Steroidobacter sp.]
MAILKACEALRDHTKCLVKASAQSWSAGMKPIRLDLGEPLFDIVSYGRAAPGRRMYLTPTHFEQIRRTVTRVPEVMVKESGGRGSSILSGVKAHFNYIGRRGELSIETDEGERLAGKEAVQQLIEDWDLDLEADRPRTDLYAINRRDPPKLIHRIIFSMPAGTPPKKVLGRPRSRSREVWAPASLRDGAAHR